MMSLQDSCNEGAEERGREAMGENGEDAHNELCRVAMEQ